MDIDAQAARDSTASDTWLMGVRRLAVANGPNIFQMLLVNKMHFFTESGCGFITYPNADSLIKYPKEEKLEEDEKEERRKLSLV